MKFKDLDFSRWTASKTEGENLRWIVGNLASKQEFSSLINRMVEQSEDTREFIHQVKATNNKALKLSELYARIVRLTNWDGRFGDYCYQDVCNSLLSATIHKDCPTEWHMFNGNSLTLKANGNSCFETYVRSYGSELGLSYWTVTEDGSFNFGLLDECLLVDGYFTVRSSMFEDETDEVMLSGSYRIFVGDEHIVFMPSGIRFAEQEAED